MEKQFKPKRLKLSSIWYMHRCCNGVSVAESQVLRVLCNTYSYNTVERHREMLWFVLAAKEKRFQARLQRDRKYTVKPSRLRETLCH